MRTESGAHTQKKVVEKEGLHMSVVAKPPFLAIKWSEIEETAFTGDKSVSRSSVSHEQS